MKLTDTQVTEIKKELAQPGANKAEIARKYGVSRSAIYKIARGTLHADAEGPEARAYDPTDSKVRQLESKVALLTDELRQAKRVIRSNDKLQGLFTALAEELEDRIVPFDSVPAPPSVDIREDTIQEHLVMHLSDGHHDQLVRAEECGDLEEHDFAVSCRRAENYVDTVLDWSRRTLAPRFYFPHLTILAYGDHTSGEIHNAVNHSQYRNQFKNCLAIGQLHSMMFRDLASAFDSINVVYLPGNHGRRSNKKDHHGAHDNWDYLVGKTAQLHCSNLSNVNFLIPNSFSIKLDIEGHGFHVSHGDDVRSHQSIPFYGMLRRQKNLLSLAPIQSGPPVKYQVMGHHHVAGSLSDVSGELLLNGAWLGTDAYAYNSFAGFREPCQLMHGVNKKYGVTWRMYVRLRSKDDKKGPKRYKVTV